MRTPNTPDVIWARLDRRGPDECWPYLGGLMPNGYGSICINGQTKLAHRVAYEVAYGVAPGSLFVCHRCDNKRCCNPSHLFLGTCADNQRDASSKGIMVHGSRHPNSKLTEDDVRALRRRAASGEEQKALAREFGIGRSQASAIISRPSEHWSHV